MAVLPPERGSQRRPSMRGNLLQDVVRGVERNRAWPSKRLSNQTAGQKAQQEWFRQANWAFKFMAADMQATFRRATHRTSLYPRDLFSIMVSGGLAAIRGADGKVYFSMATKQAVSESLDAISQSVGYTLVRGPQFWTAQPAIPATGALMTRAIMNTNKVVPTAETAITWDTVAFDSINLFNAAQPTRLTVPAGVTVLEIGALVSFLGSGSSTATMNIRKNNVVMARASVPSTVFNLGLNAQTGPMLVSEGDYIQVFTSLPGAAGRTYDRNATALWAKFG